MAECLVVRPKDGLLFGVVAVDSGLCDRLGEVQSELVFVSGVSTSEYRFDCLMGVCGLAVVLATCGGFCGASLDLMIAVQSLSLRDAWS
jgi:hypothetical protein